MSVDGFIQAGDFAGLASHCEEAEITVIILLQNTGNNIRNLCFIKQAPQGVPSAEIYGSLLAVYLLQNEL